MPGLLPLKVCFVAPNIYPLFNPLVRAPYGGGETQLYELAIGMAKDPQTEVSVVTGDFGQDEIEYYSGVMVYRARHTASASLWKRFRQKSETWADALKKTGGLVFLMAGADPLCAEVSEFCRKYKRTFVFRLTHQRDGDRTYVNANGEEGERFRMALQNAALIFCQTHEQSKLLRRMESLRSEVIPNLIPVPPPPDYSRKHEVLWIGSALSYKQPELYMRLARTLPGFSFSMMMFPGNARYFERLIAATRDIANLGVHNSIPYPEMPAFMQRTKLIVNTSRFEGVPMAFTHALANGIPVASLNVDPDGMFSHHQCGVCTGGSEVELVQVVHDLLTYERQWIKLAKNAYQYAREQMDLSKRILEYKTRFLKCTAKKR